MDLGVHLSISLQLGGFSATWSNGFVADSMLISISWGSLGDCRILSSPWGVLSRAYHGSSGASIDGITCARSSSMTQERKISYRALTPGGPMYACSKAHQACSLIPILLSFYGVQRRSAHKHSSLTRWQEWMLSASVSYLLQSSLCLMTSVSGLQANDVRMCAEVTNPVLWATIPTDIFYC